MKKARHKIHVTQNSIYKVHRRTKLIQGDKRSKKKKKRLPGGKEDWLERATRETFWDYGNVFYLDLGY